MPPPINGFWGSYRKTCGAVSSSFLVPWPASNGFAVVMSEKRFAHLVAIILDVKAILSLVVYVEVHTFMLLKQSDICLSRRMSYRYVDMPMLT